MSRRRINRFLFEKLVQRAIGLAWSVTACAKTQAQFSPTYADAFFADAKELEGVLIDLANLSGSPAVPARPDDFERQVQDYLDDFVQKVQRQLDLSRRRRTRRKKR